MIWFGGCLLALILTAMGIAGVANRRIDASHKDSKLITRLRDERVDLAILRQQLSTRSNYLGGSDARRASIESSLGTVARNAGALRARITRLRDTKIALVAEIPRLEREIASQQELLVQSIRRDAAGENIDTLYLKDGRLLEGVTIRRVTSEGLELFHTGGSLSVSASQLPNSYRQRFQWPSR